eukprot:1694341-Amphidinium_carterae.1
MAIASIERDLPSNEPKKQLEGTPLQRCLAKLSLLLRCFDCAAMHVCCVGVVPYLLVGTVKVVALFPTVKEHMRRERATY